MEICDHLKAIKDIKAPGLYVCEECIKEGSRWVHLRTCQTCGITLCCNSSPQKHAAKHFQKSGHPVVISAERDERWLWCYHDEVMAEY